MQNGASLSMLVPLRSTRMRIVLKINGKGSFLKVTKNKMTLANQIENQTEKRNRKPRGFYKNTQGKGRFIKDYEQAAHSFLGLQRPNDLCSYLKVDFYALQDLIAKPSYRHYFIPKKSGGNRQIDAPNQLLKRIQKKMNRCLQGIYLEIQPPCAHGFVIHPRDQKKAANIVENALPHIGKKQVLNLDLENFFPSIKAKRIRDLFKGEIFQFTDNMANAITLLTTINGHLPQGAPTSPVLSNLVCLSLDKQLMAWCEEREINYTRYADDLSFSCDEPFTPELISGIRSIIALHDFRVNEKKLRKRANNKKQTVTGLVVNKKVNVDRKLIKKVRAMLFDLQLNGIKAAAQKHYDSIELVSDKNCDAFLFKLKGYINFIGQVRGKEDAIYIKFNQKIVPTHQNGNNAK
jgi:RNA-directed DNA polymerase